MKVEKNGLNQCMMMEDFEMRALFECGTCRWITPHQQDIHGCYFCKKETCPKCRELVEINYGNGHVAWRDTCISTCYPDKDFLVKNEISRDKIEHLTYIRSKEYIQDVNHGQ